MKCPLRKMVNLQPLVHECPLTFEPNLAQSGKIYSAFKEKGKHHKFSDALWVDIPIMAVYQVKDIIIIN